jgi:hypothetical protein
MGSMATYLSSVGKGMSELGFWAAQWSVTGCPIVATMTTNILSSFISTMTCV